jgi:hypothetical protein
MKEEERLRAAGFMTKSEFIEKITSGISAYLDNTWPTKPDDLHHPEDLLANTSCYIESACTTIQIFGSGNTNPKN